ncbi:hypothetical protein M409DRAFT_22024 [Zasmidium cellare ATCC 36951]|uniref:AAA+ ATPase domain-containing protein n=1 Tax=Zasmidium cellare ATCC 36951 TaxID=1080233 RepID=A0A6A6CQX4_ZASCE|nr:uncharacterized protein M409DRAFT_22024 [Zasmidium cellare ATCC 36951]KAF2167876.1 hypothetical protein M409DRAFT_22024 [Zasmidium cellare ATCC 36951]
MTAKVNGVTPNEQSSLVKPLYGIPNDRGGTTWQDECPSYLQRPVEQPGYAIITRYQGKRSEDKTNDFKLYLSSISIQSPSLKQLIRDVLGNYPGENLDAEDLSFDSPFHPFFHQWAGLLAAKDAVEKGREREEVEALMEILREEFEEALRDARNLTRNGNITFRLLWTLFPPGCPVLGEVNGVKHCFLVEGYKYLWAEQPPALSVGILHLDFDGERCGWQKTSSFIPSFAGSTKIAGLAVKPLQFCEGAFDTLDALSKRGEAAVELLRQAPVYRQYDGRVALHISGDYDFEQVENFVEERVMIEPKVHSQQASRYSPRVFTIPHKLEFLLSRDAETNVAKSRTSQHAVALLDNLNGHPVLGNREAKLRRPSSTIVEQPLLKAHSWTADLLGIRPEAFCRSVVRGYLLGSKSWAEFEVDNILPIDWNDKAFDSLVIPPARKRLLEALVRQQKGLKKSMDDVVRGKGQGLIMLLAGPPGTGKTLTAESISDHLRLPLYAISASELGDNAANIEQSFSQVLRLAASWEAVLLLDEADAFLEKRASQDTPGARERNKRVAAFLRILEYYRGILIFTTNRAVNFDDAFYSRIHLTLTFKPLDQTSREDIWRNFLHGSDVSESDISKFASEQLNGRQIKNIVKMARLLAEDSDGSTVGAEHVRDVLSVAREDFEIR